MLQRLRNWAVSTQTVTSTVIDDSKLPGLANLMAGAFTLLTAVLTFFGVKEGVLDRILRSNPRPAILIVCLIAIAAFAGLVAPALKAESRIRVVVVFAGIAALGGYTLFALPDIAPGEDRWIGILGVVAVIVIGILATALFRKAMIPIIAATLVLGLACLAFGLYGAVKLSVASKLSPETPTVTAEVKGAAGADRSVVVTLGAAKLDGDRYLKVGVVVSLPPNIQGIGQDVGYASAYPDATGSVNRTLQFNLPNERIDGLSVRSRVCKETTCAVDQSHERAYLRLAGPRDNRFVGGTVGQGDAAAKASLSIQAASIGRDEFLGITLNETTEQRATVERTAARLVPDAQGSVTWTGSAGVQGRPGNELVLTYVICRVSGGCDAEGVVVAKYAYPGNPAMPPDRLS